LVPGTAHRHPQPITTPIIPHITLPPPLRYAIGPPSQHCYNSVNASGFTPDPALGWIERRVRLMNIGCKHVIFHWQVNNIPTENIKEELLKPENKIKDTMATYNYRVFQLLEQFYNFS
jgi:hypothetical protein